MILLFGCSDDPPTPPPAPAITGLPAHFSVAQRSTTAIPGSLGALRLSTGDITRGQVTATLTTESGDVILGSRSLAEGGSARFDFLGHTYELRLESLRNRLVGQDEATFSLSLVAPLVHTEADKIEALLRMIAGMKDAVFLRNGGEHSPADAASHLRSKWKNAATGEGTAREFIERAATKSSLSGEPYRVRLADGRTRELADLLREHLDDLERLRR